MDGWTTINSDMLWVQVRFKVQVRHTACVYFDSLWMNFWGGIFRFCSRKEITDSWGEEGELNWCSQCNCQTELGTRHIAQTADFKVNKSFIVITSQVPQACELQL